MSSMRMLPLSLWLLLRVPFVSSEGAACLWSDIFKTCQLSYTFIKAQGLPEVMDTIFENVKNDNECVTSGCPPWKCTFSDMLGRCVSLKTRWILENNVPQFAQIYEAACSIYNDQNLLSGYSPCLSITDEMACQNRSDFCLWQPLLQRNITGDQAPMGSNPCHNFKSLCMPRIKISECPHCWRRPDECFRDCEPFQNHYKALQEQFACRGMYRTQASCDANTTCRWVEKKCGVRLGGFFRATEENCPLKPLHSLDGIILKKHCQSLVEFACKEDPNCLWRPGPVMENGYCPVFGRWNEAPAAGSCEVDERLQARNMSLDRAVGDAMTYYLDKLWECQAIRDKGSCLATFWSGPPPEETESSKTPEDYAVLALLVCGSVTATFICGLAMFLIGRKINQLLEADYAESSVKLPLRTKIRRAFARRNKIAPVFKFKFKSNEARDRPDVLRVSVEASGLNICGEALKPFVIDLQVATNEEDGDDEALGNRSGKLVSLPSMGKWKLRENALELCLDTDPSHPKSFLATLTHGEMKWIGEKYCGMLTVIYPDRLPEWLAPTILSDRREVPSIAQENYECPECYFDLYLLPVGVMKKHSKRVCPHYIHVECARMLIKEGSKTITGQSFCPICFLEFSDVKMLPDLMKEPSAWFATCDIDLGGTLDKREVEEALGAVMPLDRSKIKRAIKSRWSQWDPDGDGTISFDEFMNAERGLRAFVLKHLGNMTKGSFVAGRESVPELETHPYEWFEYWDKDASGTLGQDELVHAMVKTFCLSSWGNPIVSMAREMKQVAKAMWRDLDFDDDDEISFETFIQAGGLADCILHNDINGRYFGEDNGDD